MASQAVGIVQFTVPDAPVPKQRARKGGLGHWYTPQATRDYEQKVGWYSRLAGNPITGPVAVEAVFYRDRVTVEVRPLDGPVGAGGDLDNLFKSVADGMQLGGLLENDRQIREIRARFGVEL